MVATTPHHVVLVVEESFAGEAWWDGELRARYMPNFDALRARGVYFDRLYSSGTRTTRGLEGILHGVPPLPGIALNQRAGVERLPSLPRAFARAGFETVFVYGGWPGFSGFARYWRAIGYRHVLTRDDFERAGFETSWGVADEVLFERVLAEMDRRTANGDRVFLSTLTVSNHRPFDFPPGRVPYPPDDRRLEYAIAYADWALRDFMTKAANRSWFADTLFVVLPDHGPSPRGGGPIPIGTFRVPGLLLWPNGLAARTDDTVASLVDVPATVAVLAGIAGTEPFAGRDLLADAQPACAGAPVEYDYRLGWLTARGLTVLERNGPPAAFVRDRAGVWQPAPLAADDVRCTISAFESAHAFWTRDE